MVSDNHQTHLDDDHPHDHGHGPLHHHFDDMDQQRECTSLGMWAFLATEVMMFGGLFFAYTLYRWMYPQAFVAGSRHLNITLGTINTFVLLFSSLTMAMAVHTAQTAKKKAMVTWLILTFLLGGAFLGVKGVEWVADYHEGLIPGVKWHPGQHEAPVAEGGQGGENVLGRETDDPAQGTALMPGETHDIGATRDTGTDPTTPPTGKTDSSEPGVRPGEDETPPPGNKPTPSVSPRALSTLPMGDSAWSFGSLADNQMKMYFVIYFCMAGLHAIHMIIGLLLVGYFIYTGAKGMYLNGNDQPVEIAGLYWHLIDIIWIFLFPLLYLIGGFHPFGGH